MAGLQRPKARGTKNSSQGASIETLTRTALAFQAAIISRLTDRPQGASQAPTLPLTIAVTVGSKLQATVKYIIMLLFTVHWSACSLRLLTLFACDTGTGRHTRGRSDGNLDGDQRGPEQVLSRLPHLRVLTDEASGDPDV